MSLAQLATDALAAQEQLDLGIMKMRSAVNRLHQMSVEAVEAGMDQVIRGAGRAFMGGMLPVAEMQPPLGMAIATEPYETTRNGEVLENVFFDLPRDAEGKWRDKDAIRIKHDGCTVRQCAARNGRYGVTVQGDRSVDVVIEENTFRGFALAIQCVGAAAAVLRNDIGHCKDGVRVQVQSEAVENFIHSYQFIENPEEHLDGFQPLLADGLTIERNVILAFNPAGQLSDHINGCIMLRSKQARTLRNIRIRSNWLAGSGIPLRLHIDSGNPIVDTAGLEIEDNRFLGGWKWKPFHLDRAPDVWHGNLGPDGRELPLVISG